MGIPSIASLQDVAFRTLVDSVIFTLAPLIYIPMSRSTLILFDCIRLPNGDFVVESDLGVACFDADWWGVFPVGLLSLLLFVLGVALYLGITLWIRRNMLFEPEITIRFGTLYRNWRSRYFYGEIANLARRLAVVVVATFLSRYQLVQIILLTIILIVSLV